jgi:DNA-binding transcriptional ArsR family regulator
MQEITRNWYAVITADVLYDRKLSPIQKLLVAMISNSSNEEGYCWATNSYFSEALGCNQRTIQRHIEELEEAGYVDRSVIRDGDGVVTQRVLIVKENRPFFVTPPPDRNDTPPPVKNVMYNNKEYNNKEYKGGMTKSEPPYTSEKFCSTWNDWVNYRKEKKQTLTPTTVKRQFKLLASMSEEDAIKSLEQSMSNGWTGLFPKKKEQFVAQVKGESILTMLNRGKGLF